MILVEASSFPTVPFAQMIREYSQREQELELYFADDEAAKKEEETQPSKQRSGKQGK